MAKAAYVTSVIEKDPAPPPTHLGIIASGSTNVLTNGKPQAMASEQCLTACAGSNNNEPPHVGFMNEGSGTVFVNGSDASRVGDKADCKEPATTDGTAKTGSDNVLIGD